MRHHQKIGQPASASVKTACEMFSLETLREKNYIKLLRRFRSAASQKVGERDEALRVSTRFSVGVETVRADAGRDSQTSLARPNSQARPGTGKIQEKIILLLQLTTSRTDTVCVCVFFPSILDIKFVGRTSRGHTGGRSHRIFNPPSFCGACLDFCREKDSAIPFPRRP